MINRNRRQSITDTQGDHGEYRAPRLRVKTQPTIIASPMPNRPAKHRQINQRAMVEKKSDMFHDVHTGKNRPRQQ